MPINPVSVYSNNIVLFNYASGQSSNTNKAPEKSSQGLSDEDQRKVKELSKRDQDVHAHEAAHVAAGGQYVKGGATFSYQKGPDGKMYAVGGEVSIDTSPVKGDPQATIAKMEAIKRAALAPADPSGQDRSVASEASLEESKARQDQAKASQLGHSNSGKEIKGSQSSGQSQKVSSYSEKGAFTPQPTQSPGINLVA
jgi:SprA-related family